MGVLRIFFRRARQWCGGWVGWGCCRSKKGNGAEGNISLILCLRWSWVAGGIGNGSEGGWGGVGWGGVGWGCCKSKKGKGAEGDIDMETVAVQPYQNNPQMDGLMNEMFEF
ncbi:unnamed protein product [Prunus armeniaca]|uniref:Uncharacterized protein n=1 Tax=Prunus armeniaca TaxID=36596 RepID=A0A6J5XP32_PRUAR|nr:unnamed protein product [Prunus armeniaca]CAB4313852.1 unnamed protein product [Prunus armeniaca]